MNLKICFLAPSGYGKTTAIKIIEEKHCTKNVKIGEPLYELQNQFYKKIGIDIGNKQDGELLQFYGTKIRKENPLYLLQIFESKIRKIEDVNLIITNDDCRPYDYAYLKELGFKFIKINGYQRNRNDHTKINPSLSIEWQGEIPCDYELNNFGNLDDYKQEIDKIMEVIKNDRKVLYYTSSETM